jgi:transcriptional regulator with XRE-family HTH domain
MATSIFPLQRSNESFGSLVVAMRHAFGLGQAMLAERAGCSPSHLSNIEHVRSAPPTEKLARRLAQGMGLTLSETKAFVAEANLARSQWHAERVRSRTRGRAEEEGASATVSGKAPHDRTAAEADFQRRPESLRHGVGSSAAVSPASALFRDRVSPLSRPRCGR